MTESGAFERIAAGQGAKSGLLFLCDHAANRLPPGYGSLGLPADLLASHIAYDIGAADVTRALAGAFNAPAILASWSRLLVDLNRGPDDPTLVMKLSDGSIIPGNAAADDAEVAARIRDFHTPYHAAIDAEIAALAGVPVLVSIHSFTPVWKGRPRPWQFGILWDRDDRLAAPLIARLEQAGFVVGNNEPYSGELENDTLYRHATMAGLPHVLIEIRQDLIATRSVAQDLAAKLQPILQKALQDMGPAGVKFTRPRR
jgi:predicted N-formylglutamate amidohydrolase